MLAETLTSLSSDKFTKKRLILVIILVATAAVALAVAAVVAILIIYLWSTLIRFKTSKKPSIIFNSTGHVVYKSG